MRRFVSVCSVVASFLFLSPAFAESEPDTVVSVPSAASSGLDFAPEVVTVFPTFVGVGGAFLLGRHFEIGGQYGLTPTSYYNAIAATAAHLSHDEDYKNIINAAFSDNTMVRANVQYDFNGRMGWRFGIAADYLHSSGDANINDVLQASSSNLDFTLLKAELAAEGKDSVNMKTTMVMGEAYLGYAWNLFSHVRLGFDLGVLKVISSDIKLSGGTAYEQTPTGHATVTSTQDNIESIIKKYGISPTAQFSLDYVF